MKHCIDCPVRGRTEHAEMAVNYGCLPSYGDMEKWYNETGKVWACHDNPKKVCGGFKQILFERENIKLPSKPILITEEMTLEEIYNKSI